MGWMHDTLDYFKRRPIHRRFHHNDLTFRMLYAWHENWVLPLSHDEVVHGKGSLLGKMSGDMWQKFANLRLLFGSMFGQPGKKLLFMGSELAQWHEWNHEGELDWKALEEPESAGVSRWLEDLNRVYREEPALHELDCDPQGFEWIDPHASDESVLSWIRKGRSGTEALLFVCNYTPVPRGPYRVGVPWGGRWRELLNSDAREYEGSGVGNGGGVDAEEVEAHGRPCSVNLSLPPLGVVVLKGVAPVSPAAPRGKRKTRRRPATDTGA
jgi:1,4-alpha-glucan branching enzyme